MKKAFIKIASIAMLVAGVAFFASCEKENNENGLTTNAQTKIGGSTGEALPLPPGDDGDDIVSSKVTIFYWHISKTHDENGKLVFIKECLPKWSNHGVCLIRIDISDEDFGVGGEELDVDMPAIITLNGDHQLTRLSINTENLNPKDYESLSILADKIGYVEFNENIVINDEEGLLPFEVKEVPAGKYPISLIDNEFIIDFEY